MSVGLPVCVCACIRPGLISQTIGPISATFLVHTAGRSIENPFTIDIVSYHLNFIMEVKGGGKRTKPCPNVGSFVYPTSVKSTRSHAKIPDTPFVYST